MSGLIVILLLMIFIGIVFIDRRIFKINVQLSNIIKLLSNHSNT